MNRYLIGLLTPLAVLFCTLVLGGCYSSPVPLEEAPSRPVDSEWIGAWVGADNPARRMTVRDGGSGWYEIDAVDEEKNKRYAIRAFTTELEGEVIVSFQKRGETEWNFARVRQEQGGTKEIGILSMLNSVPKRSTPAALRSAMRTIVHDPEAFDIKLNARRMERFGATQNVRAQESERYGVAQDMAWLVGQKEGDGIVVPRDDLSGEVKFPTFSVGCSRDGRPLIDFRTRKTYRGGENGRVPITFIFENGKSLEGQVAQDGFLFDSDLLWLSNASLSNEVHIRIGESGAEEGKKSLRGFGSAVSKLSCVDETSLELMKYPPPVRELCSGGVRRFVEQMPKLVGGFEELQKRVRYPEEVRRLDLQGRVFVQLIVGMNGNVLSTRVLRSVHPILDKEAVRVLQSAKFTRPEAGKNICVEMSLPIDFNGD